MTLSVRFLLTLAVALLPAGMVWSQPLADSTVADSARRAVVIDDAQVRKIAHQLMAPCCWSGTVDEHQSPAADDIKKQIRAALAQGYTEPQILAGFVAAYGERILAKPRATGFNLLAWILPIFAFVIGGYVIWRFLAQQQRAPAPAPTARPAASDDPYEQRLERELKDFDR